MFRAAAWTGGTVETYSSFRLQTAMCSFTALFEDIARLFREFSYDAKVCLDCAGEFPASIVGVSPLYSEISIGLSATATSTRKYPVPFDPGSQAGKSPSSTAVRENVGTPGCRSFFGMVIIEVYIHFHLKLDAFLSMNLRHPSRNASKSRCAANSSISSRFWS